MDEQQPLIRNAVTYIDDKPQFELKADELVVRVGATDSERYLCVHLRPYTSAEMKDTLKALKARVRDAGTSLIQEDADPAALRRLASITFQRLSHVRLPDSTEPTADQQRRWFQQNPRLQARVANEAFATVILLGPARDTEASDDLFELVLDDSGARVKYLYFLDSPGKKTAIEIVHHFEAETETDYQAYDRASRRETDKRSGFTTVDIDYDALEKLWNRTIRRVDGMVLDGEACTEANRDRWMPLVPFWHKLIALNSRFDEVLKKNNA